MASGYNAGVRYGTASGEGLSWVGLSETLVCQTTPTNTPMETVTQTPTPIATSSVTATLSRTPSASATVSAGATASGTGTPTRTPTRTASATATASASSTATPTASPSASLTASPTSTGTATASRTPSDTPAPFRLYMQSGAADIAGYSILATSPGTAAATGAINTVGGPTVGVQFAGKWMSCPLAAPVTVTGPVTADGWGRESNGAANVGLELRLYKYSGGVEGPAFFAAQSPGDACNADGTGCAELAVLNQTFNEYSWSGVPTSTSFAAGDRVVAKWFGNDAGGGAMASGYNAGVRYGTASGEGLSWVGLSEAFICQTTPTITPTQTVTQTPTPIPDE